MRYTVEAEIVEGCECEDCQAGRHVYSLYEWTADGWRWAAISLQSYASADECKQFHWWGIELGPDATWEDGAPVVVPQPKQHSSTGQMVALDIRALQKSAQALEKHWRAE